jgi:hypothetical protein
MELMNQSKNEKEFDIEVTQMSVINDYFLFDSDDAELSLIKRTIDKNLLKYNLSEKEKYEICQMFKELLLQYEKCDFNDLTFPLLKHSISAELNAIKIKLSNNKAQQAYFLLLLFSNLSKIRKKLQVFYSHKIKENNFGIPKVLEGMINPNMVESYHYKIFLERITNWYVKNEFILFFLYFLNDFFDIRLNFDENNFSVDKNYEFSLKNFMKKSFFKLSGYLLSKLSVFSKSFFFNRAMSTVNYRHLLVLFLSSFTYGISLKKFMVFDLKPFALIVLISHNIRLASSFIIL